MSTECGSLTAALQSMICERNRLGNQPLADKAMFSIRAALRWRALECGNVAAVLPAHPPPERITSGYRFDMVTKGYYL